MTLTPEQAAVKLGKVYDALHDEGWLPAGDWVVPDASRKTRHPLTAALSIALRPPGWSGSYGDAGTRKVEYREAYLTVIPITEHRARQWLRESMTLLRRELTDILTLLASRDDVSQIQEVAREAMKRSGRIEVELTDDERALRDRVNGVVAAQNHHPKLPRCVPVTVLCDPLGAIQEALDSIKARPGIRAATRRRLAVALAQMRDDAGDSALVRPLEVLAVLHGHPEGLQIICALADPYSNGARFASGYLKDAVEAIDSFMESVKDPDDVWRYPVAIVKGAERLRLAGNPSFVNYLLELAGVRGERDDPLFVAGLILTGLAIVFAPVAVGVGIAVAALGLDVYGVYQIFLAEREADLAYGAAVFLPESDRFATEPADYRGTTLGIALAMLGNLALVRGLARPLRGKAPGLRGKPPAPRGKPPAAVSTSTTPAPVQARAAGTIRGAPEAAEARAVAAPPPDTGRPGVPSPQATGRAARRPESGAGPAAEAHAVSTRERAVNRPAPGSPRPTDRDVALPVRDAPSATAKATPMPSATRLPPRAAPPQIKGKHRIGPAYRTLEEATASLSHPEAHVAEIVLKDKDGRILRRWWEISEPGLPAQVGHTEQKALMRVDLQPGETLEIRGWHPPCPYGSGCHLHLEDEAIRSGADIFYMGVSKKGNMVEMNYLAGEGYVRK